MSKYIGDFSPGAAVVMDFNTHKGDGTPITLAGTPAVYVYKGTSTDESNAGVNLSVDFDGKTGLHVVSIDTSQDSEFYAAGSDYRAFLSAGTVDGVSQVGRTLGSFSIYNRSPLRPTTAGRTLDVSAGGEAGVDLANVGNPTTTLALTGTTISTSQQVASVSGSVGSVSSGVTVQTNNDKTGYSLSQAFPTNFASMAIDADGKMTYNNAAPPTTSAIASQVRTELATELAYIDVAISSRSTYAGADTAGTTTLVGLLTATRAGYLDKLNISGNVASQADVQAINQSAAKHLLITTVGQYERPESGSTVYTVEVRTFSASTGAAVNADSTPTLTATGQTSGDLSANLSAATNPSTGVYRWTYTVANDATNEPIRMDVSATISSSTYTLSAYTQVVDVVSATWTTSDAAKLSAIYDKVPAYTPTVSATGKTAVTFDWSADVTNKPTIGTSTLTTSDIDSRLAAWGKTDFALASSTGWGGAALPTAFAANNLPTKYSDAFDWNDVVNKPTIGTSTLTTGDIDNRLAAWGKSDFTLAAASGWGGAALPTAFAANNLPSKYSNAFDWNDVLNGPTIGTSTLTTEDIALVLAAWGKAGYSLSATTGWGGSALPSDYQQREVAVTLPETPPDGYGATLTAEQIQDIADAMLATDIDDDLSLAKSLQVIIAAAVGKTSRSGSTIRFMARDGTTTLATLTFNPDIPGEITASTIS